MCPVHLQVNSFFFFSQQQLIKMQYIFLSFVSLACAVAMVTAYGTVTTGGFSGYNSYHSYMPYTSSYGYVPMMPVQYGRGGFGMTGGSMGLGGGMSSCKWLSWSKIIDFIFCGMCVFLFLDI